jgi:hypothetical protein
MHRSLALVLVTTACAGALAPIQVDGQYRVTIEQTSNTCSDFPLGSGAPGLTTRLDLFARSDGLHDLHWVDGWVPEDFAFSAVDLGDGSVRHGVGGSTEVVGEVTADALELELVHRGVRSDTGNPCERRAIVRGPKRPMFSPDTVDGRYIVSMEHRGATCANGDVIPPAGAWNMRMEVPFRDDRTSVLVEDPTGGLLRFWIEPIGRGGPIRLTRDLFFAASGGHITQLDGTIEGTILPGGVDLAAELVAVDDPDACVTSYAISGRRWTPSSTSLDTEYRTTYRLSDTCDPSFQVSYEDTVIAVGQADGRIDLIDNELQSTVSLEGDGIAFESNGVTYRGTITPDRASYSVEGRYVSAGRACMLALEVEGGARYR